MIPIDVCLFIDGLDEFEGPQGVIADLVTSFPRRRTVKACVSSRPFNVFENAFEGFSSLKLQDFTFDAIRTFVEGKLLKHPRAQRFIHYRREEFCKVMDLVVRKAEGKRQHPHNRCIETSDVDLLGKACFYGSP